MSFPPTLRHDGSVALANRTSSARKYASPHARRGFAIGLAVGDAAVLILWATLGLLHHTEGVTFDGLARNAGPILIGWFAAAAIVRLYTAATRRGWRPFLLTWATGITAGVLLRSLILRRAWNADELAFLGVTLLVTLVLLALWRVVSWVASRVGGLRPAAASPNPGSLP